jgi:hypothetical protein
VLPPPRKSNISARKFIFCSFFLAAAASAPVLAQPTISCATDPAIFNTGIDGSSGYSANSPRLPRSTTGRITGNPINDITDTHWEAFYDSSSLYTSTLPSSVLPSSFPNSVWSSALVWRFFATPPSTGWATPAPNAEWVGYNNISPNSFPSWYRYQFNLESGVLDSNAFNLSLELAADGAIYHVYVNNVDHVASTSPFNSGYDLKSITLDKGWKTGPNEIVVGILHNGGGVGLLAQTTGAPLCKAKAVPTLDRSAYWLTGFGILALAGFAARRRRVR